MRGKTKSGGSIRWAAQAMSSCGGGGAAGGGTALLYASKGLLAGFKERGLIANFDQQVR